MMERGHNRYSCGGSSVPFLDLENGYRMGSVWENSSTNLFRKCALCMLCFKKKGNSKKNFIHDIISHFSPSLVPQPCLRSRLPQSLSRNWAPRRKLMLPGPLHGCGHLSSCRSRFTCNNLPREVFPWSTKQAIVILPLILYSIGLFYFFRSTSNETNPLWFTHYICF